MIIRVLHCPYCHGSDIVKHGLSSEGKQRYRCPGCLEGRGRTFLLEYSYPGQSPEVKQQIVDMALNASGIRDTARVLQPLHPEQVEVEIWRADEREVRHGLSSELDEMWSYVRRKANPRWCWHAIDHHTGQGLASVFGRRQDTVFVELKALLKPCGITRYFTDGWGAYERHLDAEQHQVGKEHTQKIESKHLNLRTRIKGLVRRTLCFSKTEHMHDLVIGLFINRYAFSV